MAHGTSWQAIYVFVLGIPIFIDTSAEANRTKWGLWILHKLVITAIYGVILYMYNSKWRERLPGELNWCDLTAILSN